MKIILLKDVKGVGQRFDEKEVSSGHATNFLIPQKLAVAVSPSTLAMVKQLKEQGEKSRFAEQKELDEKLAKRQAEHEALEKFRQSQKEETLD